MLSSVSRNRGRSWNVFPVDTGAHLYQLNAPIQLNVYIIIIIIIIIIYQISPTCLGHTVPLLRENFLSLSQNHLHITMLLHWLHHHTTDPSSVGAQKEHTLPQHLAIKSAVVILYQHVSTYFRQGLLTF
jgi:hypothetical protein